MCLALFSTRRVNCESNFRRRYNEHQMKIPKALVNPNILAVILFFTCGGRIGCLQPAKLVDAHLFVGCRHLAFENFSKKRADQVKLIRLKLGFPLFRIFSVVHGFQIACNVTA